MIRATVWFNKVIVFIVIIFTFFIPIKTITVIIIIIISSATAAAWSSNLGYVLGNVDAGTSRGESRVPRHIANPAKHQLNVDKIGILGPFPSVPFRVGHSYSHRGLGTKKENWHMKRERLQPILWEIVIFTRLIIKKENNSNINRLARVHFEWWELKAVKLCLGTWTHLKYKRKLMPKVRENGYLETI